MKRAVAVAFVAVAATASAAAQTTAPATTRPAPRTPIEHLIVVIGENLSFDGMFATYKPKSGAAIHNLLAQGIVDATGNPGPEFARAAQRRAEDLTTYEVTPRIIGTYDLLPLPGTPNGAETTSTAGSRPRFPNGPYPLSRAPGHASGPVHRFFQMWQQIDGGKRDLYVWVGQTSGEIARRRGDPTGGTNQGGVAMSFHNMGAGELPYFRELADTYAISDNHHHAVMGGSMANYQAFATGHAISYWRDGKLGTPPAEQIENPNPRPGSNNWYTHSGYRGGSYMNCSDRTQPGVKAIRDFLAQLPYPAFNDGNCEPGAYYLVNNYPPAMTPFGAPLPSDAASFRIPPHEQPTIAELLDAHGVTWKWYFGGRDGARVNAEYCVECDPLTYSRKVMEGPAKNNLQDHAALMRDLASESAMPAVAFVNPPNSQTGHPVYSTMPAYEAFVRKLVDAVKANPALWAKTAILITVDEGGGYWDSGYVQFIDAFGDGVRVPLIVVSPFAKKGHVDHTYTDHVSILKFIEANWKLPPVSARSRDRLPNPEASEADPYVPANRPAIGDLMNLFSF
jgi:phospholipase C